MKLKSYLVIFVAILASLLEVLDSSIVNVVIPNMMGSLGVSMDDISAVVTSYAIANAVILPLAAWLGMRLGKRRYYLGCIAAFTFFSFLCGISPNLTTLVLCRIFQGLAGGALLPTSQEIIFNEFPPEKIGTAASMFGASVIAGPALGPVLGGYLTDAFGWRSIFNINVPLGILAIIIGLFVIHDDMHAKPEPDDVPKKTDPIDIQGLVLLCAGIGCLQYVLERGEANDWFSSNFIIACSVISVVSLVLFVRRELKISYPILDVRLFRHSYVTNGVILMAATGFFLYSSVFVTPFFIDKVFHYSVTRTGILFLPGSLLTVALMPVAGSLLGKVEIRLLIGAGFAAIVLCLLSMNGFSTSTTERGVLNALYLRGFALAFLFLPITTAVMSQFSGYSAGQISGILNLLRQIGGSFSIALSTTILSSHSHRNFVNLTSNVSLLNETTRTTLFQAQAAASTRMSMDLGFADPLKTSIMSIGARLQQQVFVLTFNELMFIIMLIELLCIIPLIRLKLDKKITGAVMTH